MPPRACLPGHVSNGRYRYQLTLAEGHIITIQRHVILDYHLVGSLKNYGTAKEI